MQCPECNAPMDPQQTSTGVELDVCPQCRSIWFDRGEILFFVKKVRAFSSAITEARERAMESGYLSPADGAPMVAVKTPIGGAPAYLDLASGGIFLRGTSVRALREKKQLTIEPATSAARAGKRRDTGRKPPSLWPRTIMTLAGFYGGLTLVLITVSLLYGLSPGYALSVALVVAGIQFAISPFLMDLTMRWLYKVDWVAFESLPQHLREFVEKTCGEHSMKLPRMGVIPDQSPNAFTYGHTPNNARVVVTQGMFELLDPRELEGVVGHEIGHARHWDMALMTLVQLVPMVLYYLYRAALRFNPKDSRAKAVTGGVAMGAYILYIVSEYIVLWFSRTREYHADRFGALECGSPSAMARALVKIAYGLAGRGDEEEDEDGETTSRSNSGGVAALGAMGIFDAGAAQALAVTAYPSGEDAPADAPSAQGGGRYRLDPHAVKGAMKWDLWNPWAKWYELHSTHPLVAKRLLFLSDLSMEVGEDPFIRFDLQQPESFWDEFAVDVFVKLLPMLVLTGGLGAIAASSFLPTAPLVPFGAVVAATGLAMMFKMSFRYPTHAFPDMSVETLMKQVKVSDMRPVPCRLEGNIRGRGVPGYIVSDDFVMQDDTGILFLDHRQPLAIWEALWGWLRAKNLIGEEVVVEGWFRRAPVPYVEINRFHAGGKLRRSWARYPSWLLAFGVFGFGVYLLLGPTLAPMLG